MAVLVCTHLLLVMLSAATAALYQGSQSPGRATQPFSRWQGSPGSYESQDSPGNYGWQDSPGNYGSQDSPGNYGSQDSPGSYEWQDSPGSYGWQGSVAANAQSVTSCETPRPEALIQEFFSTALAEYRARGTAQGRRRVSQKPKVPKTCTETSDCRDEAGTICCWIPGGDDTGDDMSDDAQSCVREVPTSPEIMEVTEATHSRQDMLDSVRYQIKALYSMFHPPFSVQVLPVGQGDCIAMHCPNGNLVMYDCGSRDRQGALSGMEVKNIIMEHVQRATIFISHGDEDHYNYLPIVFSDTEKVDRVIVGGNLNDFSNRAIKSWLQTIASHGKLYAINRCETCIGNCNDKLHIVPAQSFAQCTTTDSQMTNLNDMNLCGSPDISFDIIAANVGYKDKNQQSIVLKVTAGPRSMLLSGDVEGTAAATIARRVPERLQSNIFQISHHGADRMANTCQWLKAIRPDEAFVSHAFNGTHKHPRCNAIQRLISLGSLSTQAHNTLLFHCARSRRQGDLATGRICHHIFSTYPAADTVCTVLFLLGQHHYPMHTCYSVAGRMAQEYEY